jgi:hypothetical protein
MPLDTSSKGKATVRGNFEGSDAQHLSPSPPRISEAVTSSVRFDAEPLEPEDRLRTIERDLVTQKETTHDMFQLLRELKYDLTAMRTASNMQDAASNTLSGIPKPKYTIVRPPDPTTSAPTRNCTKPGVPKDFDGEREKGRAFFNSCRIYIRNCEPEFVDDQAKIMWALSYMKSGRAASFVDRVLHYEDRMSTT